MHCHHIWEADAHEHAEVCPKCGFSVIEHKVERSLKRNHDYIEYALILQKFRGWQVLRLFMIRLTSKRMADGGYSSSVSVDEVRQQWINSDGDSVYMSRCLVMCPNWTRSPFQVNSNFIIRKKPVNSYNSFDITNINVDFVIVQSLIDKFRYCGVTPKSRMFGKYNVEEFVDSVLQTYMSEILLKQGLSEVLMPLYYRHYFDKGFDHDKRMAALRIALRHKFFSSANMTRQFVYDWADHIKMLITLGLDVHNPHYSAPSNFVEEHNKIIAKVNKYNARIRREKERQNMLAEENEFDKQKRNFMGIEIRDGNLVIMPLHNINEFYEEGNAMHHCVSTYRLKANSLILSARIGDDWYNPDIRAETVEVSLSDYKIIQSRGLQNQSSDYHDAILKLVNDNMDLIKKINETKA